MRTREKHQIANALRVAAVRSHDLFPSAIKPWQDQINFIVTVRPVLGIPKFAGEWIKGQAKAISNPISVILCQLSPKWIIVRDGAVVVDAEYYAGIVGVRSRGEVLQL